MAQTPSSMVELGTAAPPFRLADPSGRMFALEDFRDAPALLVMFICNHCPFVKHVRSGLASFAHELQPKGLAIVAINSNDVQAYPDDRPEKMAEEAKAAGYTFPYLFDETQSVAKAYDATCTPDFFLFDRDRKLAYRGQFDDSRPSNGKPVTGADLRTAAEALLAGRRPSDDQRPSIGCNIKWKA